MSEYPYPGSLLLWKFLCSPDKHGTIWWHWEAWTQAGQRVTTSSRQFDTFRYGRQREGAAKRIAAPLKRSAIFSRAL